MGWKKRCFQSDWKINWIISPMYGLQKKYIFETTNQYISIPTFKPDAVQ